MTQGYYTEGFSEDFKQIEDLPQTNVGFPSDDQCSLQQMASESCNLDIWYSSQFVQNECQDATSTTKQTNFILEHTPILEGTITGTVYRGTHALQTFYVSSNGTFTFTDIGRPLTKAVSGTLNCATGEVGLKWNKRPGACRVVVCYEYNIEPFIPQPSAGRKPPMWTPKPQQIKFVMPTFKKFFTSEQLADIAGNAHTTVIWDFNSALGDTIKEKYESLYVKAVELMNVLVHKGAMGYFWIVASPEVCSIFETATAGFAPCSSSEYNQYHDDSGLGVSPTGFHNVGVGPTGIPEVSYRGSVNYRWRLYADTEMPQDVMIMGCNDVKEDDSHYGVMKIANFII